MSIPSRISSLIPLSVCNKHFATPRSSEQEGAMGYLVAGWVLYMAGTKICGYRRRCSPSILPAGAGAGCPQASASLPCSYPSPACSCLLLPCPLRSHCNHREPGESRARRHQWQSRPTFGCVPFPFPMPGSDTGEKLDPDRMP